MMRNVFLLLTAGLLFLAAIVSYRTFAAAPVAVTLPTPPQLIKVNSAELATNLSQSIRFKTVSNQDPQLFDLNEFIAFQNWLQQTYPDFYAVVKTQMLAGSTQLNIWQGSDQSLSPVVFLAHQDVVPADETANSGWIEPPFAGNIKDGFIWGRGAIDDKGSLIAMLEAANRLAASGYQPKRTLIFGFGHDEEVGGNGAKAIAALLQSQGIRPWAVFDEGGAITTNMPDIAGPVARIGVAEKGYLTLILTARATGGHSSTPPKTTALGGISRAIAAVEANPFEKKLDPVLIAMLQATAKSTENGFVKRMILSNLWLFGGLVEAQLLGSKSGSAILGTTIAPTILHAGTKENILPREAIAYINFRIAGRDSIESVISHISKAINNPDIEITISNPPGSEPTPISQIGTGPYAWLSKVITDGFPGTLIAPNTVPMATDSRHFTKITDDIYRFAPYTFDSSDLSRIHGLNERIGVDDFAKGVQVYYLMLERAGQIG
ncbi:MAG: M20 family peptidase [Robiginitomaculum sp.]|nr:M20 family peptidase [Robiginitomaculum sp.]